MGKLFSEFTEEKWEQLRTHPYFAKSIKAITEKTEKYLATDPPRIKFSEIHLYVTTGNRTIFQRVYVEYQDRMEHFLFMYLLTKDEKYIEPLADIIWNICDFETWTIPAHVREDAPEERRHTWLDLCSTIMGFRIAEVLYFVGDKLPDLVRNRAAYEVRTRVIDSYRDHKDFWWMWAENNWSSVCIAAVLGAYVYLATPEEIDAQIPRMVETINCYLRGFDDDGCCKEGYSYWSYGFSYFCMFASLLREYTDGKINLFDNEKVHCIALFQQNAVINENQLISFSDCPSKFTPAAWLSHFLKNEYPDMEIPGYAESPETVAPLRYLLWQRPELADSKMNPKSYIFEDAQWFIYRSEKYNFACKAGHNNEPHNHNDVGSFVVSRDGAVSFTDPGSGEYTRQYFSEERYTIVATSSRGHSVPIINGRNQVTSKVKSTVYEQSENKYVFSMENGYDDPTLTKLTRKVECGSESVTITDKYEFSEKPTSITERFVSYFKPVVEGNTVKCGSGTLVFDPTRFDVSVSSEELSHSLTWKDDVYFVDLAIKEPSESLEISVEIR